VLLHAIAAAKMFIGCVERRCPLVHKLAVLHFPALMLRRICVLSLPSPFQLFTRRPSLPSTFISSTSVSSHLRLAPPTSRSFSNTAPREQDPISAEIQKDVPVQQLTAPVVDWQVHLTHYLLLAPNSRFSCLPPPPPISGQCCGYSKFAALCLGRRTAYRRAAQVEHPAAAHRIPQIKLF
jgi:hypothetical protein